MSVAKMENESKPPAVEGINAQDSLDKTITHTAGEENLAGKPHAPRQTTEQQYTHPGDAIKQSEE